MRSRPTSSRWRRWKDRRGRRRRKTDVPRMLRSAPHLAAWCAAKPGSQRSSVFVTVPALRSSVKNAAPRPGHARLLRAECLEGDDGVGVLDAGNHLDLFVDEV